MLDARDTIVNNNGRDLVLMELPVWTVYIYIIPKKIDSQTIKCPKQGWQRFWLPPNILPWSVRAVGSCFSKRGKHG